MTTTTAARQQKLSKEAHRALELLEEYHARLTRAEDQQLRIAIERVITIFKSRLFQALLDIQEFYESTLLDEHKTQYQKARETNDIAQRWEVNPPFGQTSTQLPGSLPKKQDYNGMPSNDFNTINSYSKYQTVQANTPISGPAPIVVRFLFYCLFMT